MAIGRIDYVDDAQIGTVPNVVLQAPACTPDSWAISPPWFDESGWVLPMGGYLLHTDGRVILVDAGLGPHFPSDAIDQVDVVHTGRLITSLQLLHVQPHEVTDVVLTHLHPDHVGWIAPQGTPIFADARHHCHRADLTWLTEHGGSNPANAVVAESLRSVADLLLLAEGDRTDIAESVSLRLFAGHTPGNCIVDIDTGDGPLLLLGDTAHHPVQLVQDGWRDRFDEDPTEAARARNRVAEEMERTGAVGVGAHFPGGRGGRITRNAEGARSWHAVDVPQRIHSPAARES